MQWARRFVEALGPDVDRQSKHPTGPTLVPRRASAEPPRLAEGAHREGFRLGNDPVMGVGVYRCHEKALLQHIRRLLACRDVTCVDVPGNDRGQRLGGAEQFRHGDDCVVWPVGPPGLLIAHSHCSPGRRGAFRNVSASHRATRIGLTEVERPRGWPGTFRVPRETGPLAQRCEETPLRAPLP